jgi:hypothetical protein
MLYPKCPRCGGKSTTAENDTVSYANRHMGRFARGGMTGHSHPLLGLVSVAISVGDFAYKRFPGGGKKRCTACSHEFS